MMSTAAVFDGQAGQLRMEAFPAPELHGGEMLVRVLGCTLCGSDLHSFEGRRSVPVPTVLGHEIVGEIVSFGESAARVDLAGKSLVIGDRITWAIVANCGHCVMCQRGLPQKCLRGTKYGHEPLRPGRELLGGLAEHCLLVEGTAAVKLPDALPLAVACPASCATATVAAGMEAAGELHGRSVCLFGAGMLGLTACAIARAAGAVQIICVDPIAERSQRALQFGATHSVHPDALAESIRSITNDGLLDVMIELSGKTAAFELAWPLLRTGATVVLVGAVFPDAPVSLLLEQVVRRHLTIRGIHNYAPRHLLAAVQFLAVHHQDAPFDELVTRWYSLDEIHEAFAASANSGTIRVGVTPASAHQIIT